MINEEIIKRHLTFTNPLESINDIINAARKDEAMKFGEWLRESSYQPEGDYGWEDLYTDAEDEPRYTTEQLYKLFKTQDDDTSK